MANSEERHFCSRVAHNCLLLAIVGTLPRGPYLLYVSSRALYRNFRPLLHAFRDSGLPRDFDLLPDRFRRIANGE